MLHFNCLKLEERVNATGQNESVPQVQEQTGEDIHTHILRWGNIGSYKNYPNLIKI